MIIRPSRSSTRRIGVDLGGRRIAWSTFVDKELVDIDHFEIKATGNRAQELHACSSHFAKVLEPGDQVFIEEPMIGKGVRSSLQLAQMGGAVLNQIAAKWPDLNPTLVPVDSWKKLIIGKGGVSKERVSEWLENKHEEWFRQCLYERPRAGTTINQDRVDAICLGLYGMEVTGPADRLGPVARG